MFGFSQSLRIYLCTLPVDMRKSYDGLAGCVDYILHHDPLSGHLYVFFNKRRNMVKMLLWDQSGFALFCKRLESGTYRFNFDDDCVEMKTSDLLMILDGIDINTVKRHKRFFLKKY